MGVGGWWVGRGGGDDTTPSIRKRSAGFGVGVGRGKKHGGSDRGFFFFGGGGG